jgi:hypothetical protein
LASFQPEIAATFTKTTAAKRIPTTAFQVQNFGRLIIKYMNPHQVQKLYNYHLDSVKSKVQGCEEI